MATSTSQTAFLTLEKTFTYRGTRERFANVYHLTELPLDPATWNALAVAAWQLEKVMFPADVQFEMALGHAPGTPPLLVFEMDVSPPGPGGDGGTFVPAAGEKQCPGDAATWMRWTTTQKTSRGKPIYLRNYFHAVVDNGTPDIQSPTQKAKLDALGFQWVDGIFAGTQTFRRAGPRGAVAQGHSAAPFITTRTLKARGKRKRAIPKGATIQLPPIMIN